MEGKININIDAALQLAKERKAKDVISSAMNAFKITKKKLSSKRDTNCNYINNCYSCWIYERNSKYIF